MSDSYHKETIERITEQQIEEEIVSDIFQVETDAVTTISNLKNETINYIKNQTDTLKQEFSLDENSDGIRKTLNVIDAETTNIYLGTAKQEGIVNIVPNTEKSIESNVRDMINTQFTLKYENDGSGNITVSFAKK